MKDRGGTIVGVDEVVGGFGAGTGGHVEVAVGSEFGMMVNAMVVLFTLQQYSLRIPAVQSTAHLWMWAHTNIVVSSICQEIWVMVKSLSLLS